ncbi:MAG: anaerobic ribonucleoside-triphosphate reductase [Oscillospiraceae bacterium]
MTVEVKNGEMEPSEINYYASHIREKNPGMEIDSLTLNICDDGYIDANYTLNAIPVERIRRITGYLVGTVDRFNDAKRAEVRDRVKHMSVS